MNTRNDNGTTAATLILCITGIAAIVFGLWLYEWMVILTK